MLLCWTWEIRAPSGIKPQDNYSVISHPKAHKANAVMRMNTTIDPDRITDSLMKLPAVIVGSFVAL